MTGDPTPPTLDEVMAIVERRRRTRLRVAGTVTASVVSVAVLGVTAQTLAGRGIGGVVVSDVTQPAGRPTVEGTAPPPSRPAATRTAPSTPPATSAAAAPPPPTTAGPTTGPSSDPATSAPATGGADFDYVLSDLWIADLVADQAARPGGLQEAEALAAEWETAGYGVSVVEAQAILEQSRRAGVTFEDPDDGCIGCVVAGAFLDEGYTPEDAALLEAEWQVGQPAAKALGYLADAQYGPLPLP
ncbi:MAG: hypothetical protein ACFCVG_09625 [Kineosporiaceae bacterium]